ncbi:unnamed protein product [Boreogadus saida]
MCRSGPGLPISPSERGLAFPAVGCGSRPSVSFATSAGGEELTEHGPIGGQGLGQLCEQLVLFLVELALPLGHLGQTSAILGLAETKISGVLPS